jgi:phospholipid N-methyltransferase
MENQEALTRVSGLDRRTACGEGDARAGFPGMLDGVRFFGSFLRRPGTIGSVVPSSKALARAMLGPCGVPRARTVVEFGPGTGPFTAQILEQLDPRALFLALELDPGHARMLEVRFPKLRVYCDSAEQLGLYLRRHGAQQADCIISGLPWANMPQSLQRRILGAAIQGLAPEGVFATFSYIHTRWMPTARRFRQLLTDSFSEFRQSPIVWGNFPPAVVYSCKRPRSVSNPQLGVRREGRAGNDVNFGAAERDGEPAAAPFPVQPPKPGG